MAVRWVCVLRPVQGEGVGRAGRASQPRRSRICQRGDPHGLPDLAVVFFSRSRRTCWRRAERCGSPRRRRRRWRWSAARAHVAARRALVRVCVRVGMRTVHDVGRTRAKGWGAHRRTREMRVCVRACEREVAMNTACRGIATRQRKNAATGKKKRACAAKGHTTTCAKTGELGAPDAPCAVCMPLRGADPFPNARGLCAAWGPLRGRGWAGAQRHSSTAVQVHAVCPGLRRAHSPLTLRRPPFPVPRACCRP